MITHATESVPRTLGEWAGRLDGRLEGGDAATPVLGLADDSRLVEPGHLFFARRGPADDGARYVADALARGAVAAVVGAETRCAAPAIRVASPEEALREAADLYHGRPQDALDLVGITGTKGKTTTAWLTAAALRGAGRPTAVLGTIAHDLGDGTRVEAANTTPGALQIRRLLAQARDRGCQAAVLEVSSHALDQGRVDGLTFRSGVFTNLGRDHLDYHGDLDAYFAAKRRLFAGLGPGASAVLNREDARWGTLAATCRGRVLTYGLGPEADLYAADVRTEIAETRFRLVVGGEREFDVVTTLPGRHNVLNLLAAVGAARGLGVDVVKAARGAAALPGVPGRLERILPSGDLHVFVDYAHTAEALEQVLTFLGEAGAGDIVCVVGCGGDRDRTKRPRMAATAAARCARAYLTSDNPRTEDPDAILRDMEAGLDAVARGRTVTVRDRRRAIERAVLEAPPGACVVVAGKGHETYQILAGRRIHFDDAEEVRRALALRLREMDTVKTPGVPRET